MSTTAPSAAATEPMDADLPPLSLFSTGFSMADMVADLESSIAEAGARRAAALAFHAERLVDPAAIGGRRPGEAPARHNLLSLPAWLAVAQAAGVPAIPALPLATLPVDDFFDLMDHCPDVPNLAAAHARGQAWALDVACSLRAFSDSPGTYGGWSYDQGTVLRFEQCAPGDLKAELSAGRRSLGWIPDAPRWDLAFDVWGERFMTTLMDLGTDTVRPYARPYVAPLAQDAVYEDTPGSWPVEFRVFVDNGRPVGVSAYYPQAPLEDSFLPLARTALAQARKICAWMDDVRLGVGNASLCGDTGPGPDGHAAPWVPDSWGPQSFTLDFLVTRAPHGADRVLFLEGGPAGWDAAHPCCFQDQPWGTLSGIRLALGGATHPLDV